MIEITPFLIDLIIIAVAIEFVILAALLQRVGATYLITPLFLFLGSGALLLAAIRFALSSMDAGWMAAALFGSLCTHAASLYWAAQRFLSHSKEQPTLKRMD